MAKKILRKILLEGTGNDEGYKGIEYTVYHPEPDHTIYNANLPKKEQKWQQPKPPNFALLTNTERDNYFKGELLKFLIGVYFWNNGVLEYLTGGQYLFLAHWELESDVYPSYLRGQRDIAYMVDYAMKDPNCYGAIIVMMKRSGKSEMIPALMLAHAMLQIKAKYLTLALKGVESLDLFQRTINAFLSLKKTLPYLYDHTWTKEEITFKPVHTNKKANKDTFVSGNFVQLMCRPPQVSSVQGKKPAITFVDEFASLLLVSLRELHDKIKAQSSDGIGGKIVGKELLIATAENEKSKALPDAIKIYNQSDSDPKKGNKNGRTASGLYRMTYPYYLSDRNFVDEYGNPKIEAAKQFFENEYEDADDGHKLKLKMMYPTCAADWQVNTVSAELEPANRRRIIEHREELIKGTYPRMFVEMYMKGGVVCKKVQNLKDNDFEAQAKWLEILEEPRPNTRYIIGVDGTNTSEETSDSAKSDKSKFGITVIKLHENELPETINFREVAIWAAYPDKLEDALQMVWMLAIYYNQFPDNNYNNTAIKNVTMAIEGNVGTGDSVCAYFRNHGGYHLIPDAPKEYGTDSKETRNKKTIYLEQHAKATEKRLLNLWISLYWHNIRSIRLCDELLKVGNADIRSAYKITLLLCGNFDPETQKPPTVIPRLELTARRIIQTADGYEYEYYTPQPEPAL